MDIFRRYGFWAGIALVFIGLIVYWVAGIWNALSLVPLILGAVLAVTGVIINRNNIRELLGRRTTQYGLSSLAGILMVIVILVLANIILNNFNWRKDTTAGGQYSLADQTVKVLQNLEEDVNVTVFNTENRRRGTEDRLGEYEHYSGRFNWEFVDPDKNPEIAKQYNIRSMGTIVVESGNKSEKIDEFTEQNLTNAIIKVTRDTTKKVYFITGHDEHQIDDSGETGLQNAADAIEEQNYVAEKLFLAGQDSIPDDASVVIMAGPRTEVLDTELDVLARYIGKGGSAYFMVDPEPGQGLQDFLSKYYFEVGDNIVVDMSGMGRIFGTGPSVPLVQNYGDHVITEGFNVMTYFPLTRSVSTDVPEDQRGYTAGILARTSRSSWGETNLERVRSNQQADRDEEDVQGPVPIAAAMEVPSPGGGGTGRIVVFGDSDFATNRHFNNQGNGDLFMNSVNWLLQDEDLISVRPNQPENRRVQMSQSQVKGVLILVVILLPLLLLVSGGVVYWVRQR